MDTFPQSAKTGDADKQAVKRLTYSLFIDFSIVGCLSLDLIRADLKLRILEDCFEKT
jgi:hypothetical protein